MKVKVIVFHQFRHRLWVKCYPTNGFSKVFRILRDLAISTNTGLLQEIVYIL